MALPGQTRAPSVLAREASSCSVLARGWLSLCPTALSAGPVRAGTPPCVLWESARASLGPFIRCLLGTSLRLSTLGSRQARHLPAAGGDAHCSCPCFTLEDTGRTQLRRADPGLEPRAAAHQGVHLSGNGRERRFSPQKRERVKLLKGQQAGSCFLAFAGPQWGWVGSLPGTRKGPLAAPRAQVGLILGLLPLFRVAVGGKGLTERGGGGRLGPSSRCGCGVG